MRETGLFTEALGETKMQDRIGRVLATTPFGTDVELGSGEVLRRLTLVGSAKAGETVKLRYSNGGYTVLGNQATNGGSMSSVIGGGSGSGGGSSVGVHDFLGAYHTLPTVSAGNVLAGPVSSSGAPVFRALALADIQSPADTRYVPLTRTLTAGNGINAIGDLSANRTISLNYGVGLTISSGAVVLGTPTTLTIVTTNSVTGVTHEHAITTTAVGAVSTIVATNSSGDIRASRDILSDRNVSSTGHVYSLGGIVSARGSSAEFDFDDRTTPGVPNQWVWYANSGSAYLFRGANKMQVSLAGNLTMTGNGTFTGLVSALGSASGIVTEDRTTPGTDNNWQMYADVGALRLWSGTDKMAVNTSGYVTAVRFGAGFTVGTPPTYALDGRAGANQLRLSVDDTAFALFDVSGAGNLTITPSASGGLVRTNNLSYVGTFLSGFAGAGWRLDTNISRAGATTLELDDLVVRGRMRVYELLVTQIRSVNGNLFISSNGKIKTATFVSGASYTLSTGSGTGNQDDPYHNFTVGDLIRAQRFTGLGVYQSNMQVTAVANLYNFTATLVSGDPPTAGMDFVRLGNVSDTSRQGSIYLAADDSGSPFIDIIDGVSSFAEWGSATKNKGRIGKLSGISDSFFGTLQGYGIWTNNAYLRNAKINGSVVIGSSIGFSLAASMYLKFDTPPNSFVPNTNGHLGQRPTVYGGVAGFPLGPFAGTGAIAVSEGSTNLVSNPRFGHGTWSTGWTAGGNSTATLSTDALFGTTAMQLASTGTGHRFVLSNITRTSTANPVTVSAWVKSNTGNTLVKIGIWNAALSSSSASTDFTVGPDWTRISWTASAASMTGFGTGVNVLITNDSDTTAKTIIIGFVQAEEKLYFTSPISGDMGTSFSWASTAHASASVRGQGGLAYANSGNLPSVTGSAGGWFWAGTNNSGTNAGYRVIFHTDTGPSYLVLRVNASNALEGYWGSTQFSGGAVTASHWNHAMITSDGVTCRLYLNGVQVASTAWTAPILPSTLNVGAYQGAQQWMNGFLADLFITDRIVIADEALVITYANAPLAITRSNFELVLAEPGLGKVVGNAGGIYATDPNSVSTFTLLNSTQTFNGESLPSGSMLLGNNHATTGAANLLYNPTTGGLFIRNKQVNVISLLATANAAGQIATFDGVIGISAAGGIWQGSAGTFAAPTTGYKLFTSSSKGVWETWSSGVKQVYIDPADMSLRAGAGTVVLDTSGISIYNPTNVSAFTALKFYSYDGKAIGSWRAYTSGSAYFVNLYQDGVAENTDTHEFSIYNRAVTQASIALTSDSNGFSSGVTIISNSSGAVVNINAETQTTFNSKKLKVQGSTSNLAFIMGNSGIWQPTSGISMSIGSTLVDYVPTSANWSASNGIFATLVLNGLTYTALAFHDSAARVDVIKVGAGVIDIGPDAGWGVCTTRIHYLNLDPLTPASGSAGNPGDFRVDANYVYVCTATNTWKRVAITAY